jgi:hydroxyacylglutathione hydrolase
MHHQNKLILYSLVAFHLISCSSFRHTPADLNKVEWIHGENNCKDNKQLAIQVVKFNSNTWILRQNKCVNYEAPFLFLFIGNTKALLMDTGATEDEMQFPLYKTVRELLEIWEKKNNKTLELIVAHTHAHGDHTAGDLQFKNKPNTMVVGLSAEEVQSFFKIEQWPTENATIDLGNRIMTILPIPGHEKSSIAVYDQESQLLLSGDSFYPGRLYIRDWISYKASIQRLADFTQAHKISYILGNHIEMTNTAGKDYPTGTTFQPNEHVLQLTVNDLFLLNESLKRIGDTPVYKIHDAFIIVPKN